MAAFGIRIACYTHGVTLVTLSMNVEQSGSNNDNCQMRCVRRRSGYADLILTGVAEICLRTDPSAYSWTWVDPDVPASGAWDYVLQVKKLDGNGTFKQMLLSGVHSKR